MAVSAYSERDALLGSMGFATYSEYLGSDLWKSIRGRALSFYGRRCRVCGKARRIQVHHEAYTEANLSGASMEGLKVICERHHRKAEYSRGRKVSLAIANARLEAMSRKKRKLPGAWCAICGINRGFKGGPCPVCRKRFETGSA